MQKIISGKQAYVFRKTREWGRMGYTLHKTTQWSDGTITAVMKK